MSHHVIQANNLQYAYTDGNKAINGISFLIRHGEAVGIIGENGAGKSTLLMLLTGLLFPDDGEVRVGDVRVTKKTLPLIRQRLGMVFQDPDDQLFMSTVYDGVAFGPRNYKLDEKEVEELVEQSLETVGILHLKDRAPFRLSGGEKRAAAIATALSMRPDIIFMDEPTASLDPKARRSVIKMLKSFEHTKIVTSHDLDMIFMLCERTIVIQKGIVMADGPTKKILANQELMESCGLEIPLSMQNCPLCGSQKV